MGRTASQSTGRRAPELIPAFTFGMDQCTGLAIAVHAVNGTTRDITSILFGVPVRVALRPLFSRAILDASELARGF